MPRKVSPVLLVDWFDFNAFGVSRPVQRANHVAGRIKGGRLKALSLSTLVAATYAGLQEMDKAFDWLDRSFEARFGPLIYLKVNPIWDPMRSDPRFGERLRRVGLSQ
jgi:hypothetical protein